MLTKDMQTLILLAAGAAAVYLIVQERNRNKAAQTAGAAGGWINQTTDITDIVRRMRYTPETAPIARGGSSYLAERGVSRLTTGWV